MKKIVYTILILATMFMLVETSFAQIEPISTDRPDLTESANVIPHKSFQFEGGVFFEKNTQNGLTTKNFSYPSVLLRYGLLSNLELRMEIENIKNTTDSGGTSSSKNSVSFATIGAKFNVCEEDGLSPAVGFIINFTIPRLTTENLETDYVGTSINLSMQNSLTDELSAGCNLGAVWAGKTPEPTFFYTLALGYEISQRLSGFVEVFGFMPERTASNHVFDFGLSFLAMNNLAFDASAGFGLTENSPNYFVNGGFSIRLPE
ncbi:MAG: transporter [Candidatus Kapaibacterium sp.]